MGRRKHSSKDIEERRLRIETIKEKYKKGVPKEVVEEFGRCLSNRFLDSLVKKRYGESDRNNSGKSNSVTSGNSSDETLNERTRKSK